MNNDPSTDPDDLKDVFVPIDRVCVNVMELRLLNWLKHIEQNAPIEVLEINLIGREGHAAINGWSYKQWSPIPLTNEILEKAGFNGGVWKSKSLGLDMVGEGGKHNLVIGLSKGNEYCAPMIEMGTEDGFTIEEAAAIQKAFSEAHPNDPPIKDDSFIPLKMGDKIVLRPIKYVHQLQNLYFALTGQELEINL